MARTIEETIAHLEQQWNLGANADHIQGPMRQALTQALTEVSCEQYPEFWALASIALGYVERQAGNFEIALKRIEEARDVVETEVPPRGSAYVSARAFEEIGLVYRGQKVYDDAVSELETSHDLYRDHARATGGHQRFVHDFEGLTILGRLVRVKGILGNTLLERGREEDVPKAIELLEEELGNQEEQYQKEIPALPFSMANAYHGLAKAHTKAEGYSQARNYFRRAFEIYTYKTRSDGQRGAVNVALDWAEMEAKRGHRSEAWFRLGYCIDNISAFSAGDLKMGGADQMRWIAEPIGGKEGELYWRVEEALASR